MASDPRTPDNVPARDESGHEEPGKPGASGTSSRGTVPGASGGAVVPKGKAGKEKGRAGTEEPKQPEPADRDVEEKPRITRAGMIWTATVAGLILLVLLIIFIAQNQDQVTLRYFALEGRVNLGLALFIAAVGGGLLTAVAGAARIIQLRAVAHKDRKRKRNQTR
ncbi:LapA family protein [Crystallibacter degradans]|uniref:LapA family protein n=1 Tax=Crystallibacter degradans TaxID=2726743 RepID=UPI0014765BDA|nr:lipopolysaccharide assembly protein LapA domain-containing protein [Arthrobacter sp. SF27]NMR28424.1 DUF1049 domain-containing protein [Arthrobacter sp. SF27]